MNEVDYKEEISRILKGKINEIIEKGGDSIDNVFLHVIIRGEDSSATIRISEAKINSYKSLFSTDFDNCIAIHNEALKRHVHNVSRDNTILSFIMGHLKGILNTCELKIDCTDDVKKKSYILKKKSSGTNTKIDGHYSKKLAIKLMPTEKAQDYLKSLYNDQCDYKTYKDEFDFYTSVCAGIFGDAMLKEANDALKLDNIPDDDKYQRLYACRNALIELQSALIFGLRTPSLSYSSIYAYGCSWRSAMGGGTQNYCVCIINGAGLDKKMSEINNLVPIIANDIPESVRKSG